MKFVIITIMFGLSFCRLSSARFLPSYTHEELMVLSDLVVLMEPVSTKETEATDAQGGMGRATIAKVLLVLKGTIKEKNLTIEHFHYGATPNSPNHVIFPSSQAKGYLIQSARCGMFVEPTRQYLAFMKLQKNGTYTSVTPQFDSKMSFFAVGEKMNDLWTDFVKYDEVAATAKPPAMRKFVEVPSK
jgi:hypothetical protein